ncbi:MAG: hypothetical protein NTZ05_09525 [Chloroflexi bacterium]|nr:hypothetical protein [Chloroflexota bacterium]
MTTTPESLENADSAAEAPAEDERPLSPDEAWLKDWFWRLDQASRQNAITELRSEQEKALVDLNRELTEGIRQFSRLILELWSYQQSPDVVDTATLERKFAEARVLEDKTRGLEEQLEVERKLFSAYEEMERLVNRIR